MSPGETNDAALASVQELSRLANDVDPTDLSGLAKMHGVCEQLIEAATASGADSMASSLEELASKLGKTLEGLILGEADPPGEAMELVRHCVAGMEAVTQGGDIPDSSAGDAPVLTDAEVASKLDDLFADDATTAESPDAVQEATPAPADVPPLPTAPTVASADVPTPAAVAEIATPATDIPAYVQEDLYVKESELEFVKGFVEEAYEHIESIETAVLEVERDSTDAAKIDTLFRPFHTIKGMAGFLNLRDINCVTHEAETLLDQGRKGKREITSGMIDLIFEVVDILKAQMSSVATWLNNPTPDPIEQPPVSEMIAYLRSVVAGHVEPQGTGPDAIAPSNRIGDNLVIQGACESESVDGAVDAQQRGLTDKPTGEILMEKGVVSAKQVAHALRPQAQAQKTTTTQAGGAGIGDHSVRIDTAKLDALVDMVGELVIAQTLVSSDPGVATDEKLAKNVGQVTKIVRDVQETAMAMRMVPIGPTTFQKMARLVRDVSRKAGKQVDLTITGEETELDKNVIQQINDPLVHMVRNAVDHGVEPPHERIEAGKPEIGKVHLGAYHQGGDIVIEISDDGRGLDAKKLIEKGIEKGIVRPDEELTDNQAFNLVFAPGFSTAKEVHGYLRARRGHGRRQAKHRAAPREGRHHLGGRSWEYIRDPPAADPGDHRRHDCADRDGAIHHPDHRDRAIAAAAASPSHDRAKQGRVAQRAGTPRPADSARTVVRSDAAR